MIIDSHQHFWKLDKPFDYRWLQQPENQPINRDFLPEDLQKNIDAVGVTHTVFVQTQHNIDETMWVLELADQHDFIAGVVGWVDLASEDCERQLQRLMQHEKFVGVRHITQDERDDDFIISHDVIRGLQVLENHSIPFDLLFYTKHLKHASDLACQLPDLPLVIDHISKPKIREQLFDDWKEDLRAASSFSNVYCKLSGLVTEADWENWTIDDLRPYVETAIEFFGPNRCMFGSDWPVCELAANYQQVFNAARELVDQLSDSEQQAIFCDTAKQFYQLKIG